VNVRSPLPLTYTWLHNGVPIPGATNQTYSISGLVKEPPATTGSYWPMDEAQGNRADLASSNHFVTGPSNILSAPGIIAGAVTNSGGLFPHLSAPASAQLNYSGPFTIGGWVNIGPGTGFQADLLRKQGEYRLYYTGTAINRFRFEIGDAGAYVQDNTPGYAPGTWRFVVAWYDGTNACIQLNNGSVYTLAISPPAPTSNPLAALTLSSGMGGGIAADELFLVKRVLTANERASLYNGGFGRAFNSGEVCFGCPKSGDGGFYSVIVSNALGSVATYPAELSIVDPLALIGRQAADGSGFVLNVPGRISGTVQISSDLVNWANLFSVPHLPTPTNYFDGTSSNGASRFYRLQIDN
jgi:hypothetical protein